MSLIARITKGLGLRTSHVRSVRVVWASDRPVDRLDAEVRAALKPVILYRLED